MGFVRTPFLSLTKQKTKIMITDQQKTDFIERIKWFIEEEDFDTAFDEAGNILARVLTDDEAEWIEDVEEFGYDPDEVEQLAQELTSELN